MHQILNSAAELKRYHPRELVGTVKVPLVELFQKGNSHPVVQSALDQYGKNIVIGPLLDERGREIREKDGEPVSGIYKITTE